MSALLETLIIVLGVALVAAGAVTAKHRLFPLPEEAEVNENLADYITIMVSVLYALVLGITLVSAWEQHDHAAAHVQTEASALHEAYLLAGSLPPAQAQQVQASTNAYAAYVVNEEWPRMRTDQPLGETGWQLLREIQTKSQLAPNATVAQQTAGQQLLYELSILDDARRGRETDAGNSLSAILWAGMIIGGLLTVSFMFMFGLRRTNIHLVMVMGLAGLIAFTVLLVYQLRAPFSGFFATSPSYFTRYFPGI